MDNKNNKCNIGFQSKYAFIDNQNIHIDNYINEFSKNNKNVLLKCSKGHELICANGKIKKPYFRHKNSDDVGGEKMTAWHCEWQGNFPNTEIDFPKINEKQIKDRRADALLTEHKIVIEFQHSKISYDEVFNRKYDYDLNNHKTVWIIDGNSSINIKKLDYSGRFFIEFTSDLWKYKSFICYEYIFIDINNMIYKIYPKDVKSNMIDVEPPMKKEDFITLLNANDKIINTVDLPHQCNLFIKQQGAGNGKTYGIIQMLDSQDFEHYKYFVIVTKQHSAKYIIYKELMEQIKDKKLKYISDIGGDIENFENIEKDDGKCEGKKYRIFYTNKRNNSKCSIVIGTMDSLIYTLGNKKHNEIDKFEGLVNSIVNGYVEKTNKAVNYGVSIKLNKEVCLICDETQDLHENYGEAIYQIMRNRYIDAYIVGDKLQSLVYEKNAFTYLMDKDLSYINKKREQFINECRRFTHPKLIDFVNNVVQFKKYSLVEIKPYEKNEANDDSIIKFNGKNIYANEKDEVKISIEVEKIMEYYDNEVTNNNYKPEDFLFITPFTTKNPLGNAIETAINMYWNKKNGNDIFTRYAVFHKSEEGTSIDLKESKYATRLVSIQTSKGDGRNVVFVIGLDEQSLIRFSGGNDNLIYESLIHVAFTRMKKKLYIRIVENNDDICQRLAEYESNETKSSITAISLRKKINYQHITDSIKNNSDFEIFRNNIINHCDKLTFIKEDDDKKIIDMSHHTIRFASMLEYFFIKVIKNEYKNKISKKRQILAKFFEIRDAPIYLTDKWQDYFDTLKQNTDRDDKSNESIKQICVLQLSTKGNDYKRYYEILCDFIKNIKIKVGKIIDEKISMLCPMESIILYYVLQTCRKGIGTDITINDLYNIIDIYSKSFNHELEGHEKCLCKKHFINTNVNNKMCNYLLAHYENVTNIGKVYDIFLEKFPKVSWLIDHPIDYDTHNNDFEMKKEFKLIGYDNESVYIIYLKPQFNELNYNHILIDSIFDTMLVNKLNDKLNSKNEKNYEKFGNRNVKTILFSLDKNEYYTFEWKNENDNLVIKNKEMIINKIKEKLIAKYDIESKYLYSFYKYHKNIFIENKFSPEKVINGIIAELKKDLFYDKMPEFAQDIFKKIKNKIDDTRDKKEKINIINEYDNKEIFINKLNDTIEQSIINYLGLDDDESIESIEDNN
jgi:hypothetical protein